MTYGVKRQAHVVLVLVENDGKSREEQALAQTWADFGQKVRRLRSARGWTQPQLAERLKLLGVEMHQTTIAKLEGGTRPTAVHEIWALVKVFDVTYEDLLPVIGDELSGAAELGSAMRELAQRQRRLEDAELEVVRARQAVAEGSRRVEMLRDLAIAAAAENPDPDLEAWVRAKEDADAEAEEQAAIDRWTQDEVDRLRGK